jgi:hypothetical protein
MYKARRINARRMMLAGTVDDGVVRGSLGGSARCSTTISQGNGEGDNQSTFEKNSPKVQPWAKGCCAQGLPLG